MMRRHATALTLLVLVLLLLSACGGAARPTVAPTRAAEPVIPTVPAEPTKPASLDGGRVTSPPRDVTTPPTSQPSSRPPVAEPARPAAPTAVPSGPSAPSGSGRGTGETTRPAEAPAVASDASGRPAPTARPAAGGDGDGPGVPPESSRPCRDCQPPQPVIEPLRAGAVDDNAGYDEYLRYLKSYRGRPIWPVDVSERYLIAVTDLEQRGVANSLVRVYAGQTVVFTGRTYAGGQTIFFPRAIPDAGCCPSTALMTAVV